MNFGEDEKGPETQFLKLNSWEGIFRLSRNHAHRKKCIMNNGWGSNEVFERFWKSDKADDAWVARNGSSPKIRTGKGSDSLAIKVYLADYLDIEVPEEFLPQQPAKDDDDEGVDPGCRVGAYGWSIGILLGTRC